MSDLYGQENQKKESQSVKFVYIIGGSFLILITFFFTQFFLSPEKNIFPYQTDFNQIKSLLVSSGKRQTAEIESQVFKTSLDEGLDEEKELFKIQILEYPKKVQNICQEFNIRMEIINLSDTGFSYEYFESGTYFFDLVSEELIDNQPANINILTIDTNQRDEVMNDFEIIKSGEAINIVYSFFNEEIILDDLGEILETKLTNPFNRIDKNGLYNLRVGIGAYNENNEMLILARSDPFSVEVEVMDSEGIFKACN